MVYFWLKLSGRVALTAGIAVCVKAYFDRGWGRLTWILLGVSVLSLLVVLAAWLGMGRPLVSEEAQGRISRESTTLTVSFLTIIILADLLLDDGRLDWLILLAVLISAGYTVWAAGVVRRELSRARLAGSVDENRGPGAA